MVKRYCPKCNMEFDRKSTYDTHINRKFDCTPKKDYMDEIIISCQNMPFCAEIVPKYAESSTNKNLNVPDTKLHSEKTENTKKQINDQINSNLHCNYCNKTFASKSTLNRHLKINCNVKKDSDLEKENIFKLLLEKDKQHKEEIEELKKHNKEQVGELKKQNKLLMEKLDKIINLKDYSKSINNNISNSNSNSNNISNSNNTTNTTNTQNIVMVNFGKEDLSIIDKKQFLDRVVKKPISGVKIPEEILKIIHFNPLYPQLSNVYISDINREKLMIWEDGEWKLSPTDKIPDLIDKVVDYSAELNDDLRDKHPDNKKLNDRLDTVKKYTDMIDNNYLEDLKDYEEDNLFEIKKCQNFKNMTYDTFKTTLYNEGKNIKKKSTK